MALTATLTGTNGPGLAVTAGVFPNISQFNIDSTNNVVSMQNANGVWTFISVAAATTVTATKSGFTWTITIS